MFSATFTGHLGSDAEYAYTKDGTAVCRLSVAVYTGKDKDPLWIKCVAFDKTAEIVGQLDLKKGMQVTILCIRPFEVETFERKAGGFGVSLVARIERAERAFIQGAK